jgi:hypothetical protein
MIVKYRNLGILFVVMALAATVLFFLAARKSMQFRTEWNDYLLPLYFGAAVLWTVASYYLARAKGYGGDELGRVLMISILLGFCCQPLALVFPFLGFFLKDRIRSHRRRRHSKHRGP